MALSPTPEQALLVAAIGGPPASPARPPDWADLLEQARWHRLLPMLWHQLSVEGHGVDVPPVVADELRRLAREATARGLYLQVELDRVLGALGAAGIPVVLLKGAALVETTYAAPGLRPMADLDLLVPRADLTRAHETVAALGYRVEGTKVQPRDDEAWLDVIHHHLPLVSPGMGSMVELHHRVLVDRPGWDVEGIWARARPSDRSPARLLPAPEDLLLHVAAHFALDRMNRGHSGLGQLADVVQLARRHALDWPALVARARAAEVGDRLFLALVSAELLVGPVAPPEVVRELTPPSYTRRLGEQFVRERVLRSGQSLPLEQLAGGRRRLFGAHTLEVYVRADEAVPPSRLRLRARRFASIGRRAARLLARPRALVDDVRLSRWVLRLRQ